MPGLNQYESGAKEAVKVQCLALLVGVTRGIQHPTANHIATQKLT